MFLPGRIPKVDISSEERRGRKRVRLARCMARKRNLEERRSMEEEEEEKKEDIHISSVEAISPKDEDEKEDVVYLSVELVDFADYPILDKHDTFEIEHLESEQPRLRIGEFTLYGTYEDALGTDAFFGPETESDRSSKMKTGRLTLTGHSVKRLKFTIAPKQSEEFTRKTRQHYDKLSNKSV
jgi:general transcription factor 3C polypeptide 6